MSNNQLLAEDWDILNRLECIIDELISCKGFDTTNEEDIEYLKRVYKGRYE